MSVSFNVNGAGFKGFTVPAVRAGLIGYYHEGEPWRPDPDAIRAALPYRWRKAWDRDGRLWFSNPACVQCHAALYSTRGDHLTTVYANADPG